MSQAKAGPTHADNANTAFGNCCYQGMMLQLYQDVFYCCLMQPSTNKLAPPRHIQSCLLLPRYKTVAKRTGYGEGEPWPACLLMVASGNTKTTMLSERDLTAEMGSTVSPLALFDILCLRGQLQPTQYVNDVCTSEKFNELSVHKLQKCPFTVVTITCVNAYALQRV